MRPTLLSRVSFVLRRAVFRVWWARKPVASRGGCLLVPTLFGPMYVLADDKGLSADIRRDGYYDRKLSQFVWSLPRGTRVLVVGGNIGYFSMLAARATGTQALAAEPDARSVEALRYNAERDNVHVEAALLGDEERTANFILDPVPGNSALCSAEGQAVEVPMIRGEALLEKHPVDLLILDVQGAELLVLKGMGKQLPKTIIFEFWPYGLERTGTNPEALRDFLHAQGYVIEPHGSLDPERRWGELVRWCVEQKQGRGFLNLCACRRV